MVFEAADVFVSSEIKGFDIILDWFGFPISLTFLVAVFTALHVLEILIIIFLIKKLQEKR